MMSLQLQIPGVPDGGKKGTWVSSLTNGVSICAPVRPRDAAHEQCGAFGLAPASTTPVCSVSDGAVVNCETLTFNPHANGTHTECAGHVTRANLTLASDKFVHPPPLIPATLLSVSACLLCESGETYAGKSEPDTDMVITRKNILSSLG
jgi:hypothetical protein